MSSLYEVISFFLRFGGLAIGYILTLVIANLFGAKGLGDYVLAITVLRLFTLLSKIGLDTTSIRFIASFASQDKWASILKFRKKEIKSRSGNAFPPGNFDHFANDFHQNN